MVAERTISVRLTTGSLGRVEDGAQVIYKADSGEFLVNQDELDVHGGRLEVLDKVEALRPIKVMMPADTPEPDTVASSPEAVSSPTVLRIVPAAHWRAAKSQVEKLDTADEVRAFLDAEQDGKSRDSVVEAAEVRLRELGG